MTNSYRWHPNEYRCPKETTIKELMYTLMRFEILDMGATSRQLFFDLMDYWEDYEVRERM